MKNSLNRASVKWAPGKAMFEKGESRGIHDHKLFTGVRIKKRRSNIHVTILCSVFIKCL